MKKPTIVSGMQPSGPLHLGNYLGAIQNWLKLQNSDKYDCFFFVADYHSLTENYSAKEKQAQIFNLAVDYLASGLDPQKATIFIQSQVPECTELAWIFNTLTPVAELERMTQFKDKSSRQVKNINVGLFDYPVLQAADILLYKGELVPVGADQVQHVELTRDIARWFNNKYQTAYFPEAKPLLTPTARIMSLAEPDKKMSKSLGAKNWIGIDESLDAIYAKIKKAVTSFDGQASLQAIYEAFRDDMAGEFEAEKMSATKKIIADGLFSHFADFRKKKTALLKDKDYVHQVLADGQRKAESTASQTVKEVKAIIGLS